MPKNTLTVRIESNDEFFDRAFEAAAKADAGELTDDHYGVSLPDEAALARVLSEKNLELIRTTAREEPQSLRELARLVDRDIKNVSNAVNDLAELGLVEFEQDVPVSRVLRRTDPLLMTSVHDTAISSSTPLPNVGC
ncbi:hypothetical protein C455_05192 [Haloferax larsenii JCM 13917]|nr:transcriptional regulator [Haloferax larsenii]ELZ80829.1 hypothetical protein C455_05192 [Haloferax larsenii JCM 13917]